MQQRQQRGLTEEDKRLLRERFAQLQQKQQLEEKVEIEEGVEEKKSREGEGSKEGSKVEGVVKEAMSRVNNGEALEDVFEYCFEAGLRAADSMVKARHEQK